MEFKLTNKTKLILGIIGGVLALALVIGGSVAISNAVRKNKQAKCEHEYSASTVLKEATCTNTGIKIYTCGKCEKEEMEDIPAFGHTEAKIPAVAATCYSTGLTDGVKCAACELVLVEPTKTPILSHNIVLDKAVNATCTTSGLTEGSHCQRCDLVVKKQETVPASGHHVVTVEGKAASCILTGRTAGSKCSRCDTVFSQQEVIAALGHDLTECPAQAASCVEVGWDAYSVCSREGCKYSTYKEIEAFGHTFVDGSCEVCGFSFGADHVHAYDYESVTQAATCTEAGVLTKTCECGTKITETIAAMGHDYVTEVTTAPTCETDGVQTNTCQTCGESNKETLLALGHNYEGRVTTPVTCTTNGMKVYYCNVCPHSYTETLTATGHSFGTWATTTPATCTTNGAKTRTCGNCGTAESQNISAYGHSYNNGVITVVPTCTTAGERVYNCGSCNDYYSESIQAYGHSYSMETVTVEPTCLEYGVKENLCGRCGETITEQLMATGHTYTDGTCEDCGETIIHEDLNMSYFIGDRLTMTGTRPELGFSGSIRTSLISGITATGNQEFGVIMVSEETIAAMNGNEYTDWMRVLEDAGATYTYKTATLLDDPTGSYNTTFMATKTIEYAELNTSFVSIPCIKTTSGGIETYQYAQVITPDNQYTNYPNYARTPISVIHSELNTYAFKGTGLTTAEVTNCKRWLNEAIDLANGLSAPDSTSATIKVTGASNVSFSVGGSKTLTLSVSPLSLATFGLSWDDVVVQSELVSGKVASKDLDENGKLTLSGANAGVTTVYIYFWGVKSATFTVTVT